MVAVVDLFVSTFSIKICSELIGELALLTGFEMSGMLLYEDSSEILRTRIRDGVLVNQSERAK
jgi:hypothetical protein